MRISNGILSSWKIVSQPHDKFWNVQKHLTASTHDEVIRQVLQTKQPHKSLVYNNTSKQFLIGCTKKQESIY